MPELPILPFGTLFQLSCPECGAAAGQRCRGGDGQELPRVVHAMRALASERILQQKFAGAHRYWCACDKRRAQLEHHLRIAEETLDLLAADKREARAAAERWAGSPWIWTDTADDDLPSMSEDMTITLTAGTLRRLLQRERLRPTEEA